MLFISPQKLFSFSRHLSFCLVFLVRYRKGLIIKIKVNFKVYGVTAWLTNNCNTHIAQCMILIFMFSCNNFPFLAFITKIWWTSTEVLLNLVAPLDSAVPSLDFEQINIFWTSGFIFVSTVFDSLSVSRSLPELYFSYSI